MSLAGQILSEFKDIDLKITTSSHGYKSIKILADGETVGELVLRVDNRVGTVITVKRISDASKGAISSAYLKLFDELDLVAIKSSRNRSTEAEKFWNKLAVNHPIVKYRMEVKPEFLGDKDTPDEWNHLWAVTKSADKLVRSTKDPSKYNFIRMG